MPDVKHSNIHCGKALADSVRDALGFCAFTVTDENVARLYPDITKNAYVMPAGESSKTPETLFAVLAAMSDRKIKRGDRIAAVGGGVVGDLTGLAAALYMRGVEWTNIPTSLLAMVDSGIGGKTAVDFNGIKNLIGAFHMPHDIVISCEFLKTLPEREWLCGTGELIKTCMLTADAYALLSEKLDGFIARDEDSVFALVSKCVKIKDAVVRSDPREAGLRKILNVGHTVGHALESADGYKLSHGEYVLKGMATELAMCRDLVEPAFYKDIMRLLARFTTPPRTTGKAVCEKALSDKKNTGDTITVMLPRSAGDIADVKIERADFLRRYDDALKELKSLWTSL